MADHTATPWKVRVHPANEDRFFIEGPKNDPSHPYAIEVMGEDTGTLYPDDQKRADADFIVRAVNAHADLVDALEHAQAAIDYLVRGADVVSSDKVAGAVDHIKRALKAVEA